MKISKDIISESVDLLYKLGEPMEELCSKYISRAERCFDDDLDILKLNIDLLTKSDAKSKKNSEGQDFNNEIAMDILEFVDYGCNYFLANLSGVIQVFNSIFLSDTSQFNTDNNEESDFNSEVASTKLNCLVKNYWLKYCEIVKKRFEVEVNIFFIIFINLFIPETELEYLTI